MSWPFKWSGSGTVRLAAWSSGANADTNLAHFRQLIKCRTSGCVNSDGCAGAVELGADWTGCSTRFSIWLLFILLKSIAAPMSHPTLHGINKVDNVFRGIHKANYWINRTLCPRNFECDSPPSYRGDLRF